MDASRWTERLRGFARTLARDLRGLGGNERLAVIGAIVIVASLVLPWYGPAGSSRLGVTGVGAFGFAEVALVLTAATTVLLAMRIGGGYVPPRPLREWGLLLALGCWSALIVAYRMVDRPNYELGEISFDQRYAIRYGIVVALAGALVIVLAGLRARLHDRSAAGS